MMKQLLEDIIKIKSIMKQYIQKIVIIVKILYTSLEKNKMNKFINIDNKINSKQNVLKLIIKNSNINNITLTINKESNFKYYIDQVSERDDLYNIKSKYGGLIILKIEMKEYYYKIYKSRCKSDKCDINISNSD